MAFDLLGSVVRSSLSLLSLLGFGHLLSLQVCSPTLVVLRCAALWRRSETFPSQPDLHSDSERPDVSGCCRFRLVVEGETVDTERRLETWSRQGRCCEDETRRQENKTNPVFWFPSMFKRRVAEPNMIKTNFASPRIRK